MPASHETHNRSHDFDALTPETIFAAVEEQGFLPAGSLNALNSYENRVYEIPLKGASASPATSKTRALIAKFYRPLRWTRKQIDEEHRLTLHIERAGVAVISPLALKHPLSGCVALGRAGIYDYALFPRAGARMESELTDERRRVLGEAIGKMHSASAQFAGRYRIEINPDTYGWSCLKGILDGNYVPQDMQDNLESALTTALKTVGDFYRPGLRLQLVHGDLHPGNILWDMPTSQESRLWRHAGAKGPVFVDFDDSAFAPAVQDLWMLCSGRSIEVAAQRKIIVEAYRKFNPLNEEEFMLIEALRTLRVIRHSAWIGERYGETAFTRAFPYYTERRYWESFLLTVKEQIGLMREAGSPS